MWGTYILEPWLYYYYDSGKEKSFLKEKTNTIALRYLSINIDKSLHWKKKSKFAPNLSTNLL
jgi:hypothetical protein